MEPGEIVASPHYNARGGVVRTGSNIVPVNVTWQGCYIETCVHWASHVAGSENFCLFNKSKV